MSTLKMGALSVPAFSGWFAPHAIDDRIDDEVRCEQIMRGAFRLHPKGYLGLSQGCVVINDANDFHVIRHQLKKAAFVLIAALSISMAATGIIGLTVHWIHQQSSRMRES
ncbi:MAG TPA: tlde1 domain-containing protein [Burkholderiaceae bacterium]|nr:tlde1 domain-containing protein [Burkholderiaceae bacterium]